MRPESPTLLGSACVQERGCRGDVERVAVVHVL